MASAPPPPPPRAPASAASVEILTVDPEHPDAEYCIAEPFADRWLEKVLA